MFHHEQLIYFSANMRLVFILQHECWAMFLVLQFSFTQTGCCHIPLHSFSVCVCVCVCLCACMCVSYLAVCNFCCEERSAETAAWPVQGRTALCAWQSGPLTHRPKVWPGPNPILAPASRHRCHSGFKATDQQEPHHCSCPHPLHPSQTIKLPNENSSRHLRALLLLPLHS